MAGNSLHIPHLFTSDPLYIINSCLGKESPSILLHMHRYTHINRDCPSVLDLYIYIYLERERQIDTPFWMYISVYESRNRESLSIPHQHIGADSLFNSRLCIDDDSILLWCICGGRDS